MTADESVGETDGGDDDEDEDGDDEDDGEEAEVSTEAYEREEGACRMRWDDAIEAGAEQRRHDRDKREVGRASSMVVGGLD